MSDEVEDIQVKLEEPEAFEASLIAAEATVIQSPEAQAVAQASAEGASAPAEAATAPAEAATAPEEAVVLLGTQPAWIGKKLGRFKLLRLIGQGAMGFVVQALDLNLQRIVALKILRKRVEGMEERQKVEQFLREARAAARIEHPNVIGIYEINQHNGWWYIAMEMLEGENLRKVVKAVGPLPPAKACPIVADAATALVVAHEHGIIHRDVKPSNLMITRNGRCKLTDFGFVRVQDPSDPFDFTDRSVGTPQFMAPEVVRRQAATPASDVYSLGATLYYALTGEAPYTGQSVTEICSRHLNSPPPDLTQRLPNCSSTLAALVRSAMAKDPAQRPSAADMAAALYAEAITNRTEDAGAAPGSSSVLGRPVDDQRGAAAAAFVRARPRRRLRWALTAICAAALVGGAIAIWHSFFASGGASDNGRQVRPEDLTARFPAASETYGSRAPGERPAADPPATAPAFSWHGKVDTAGIGFVASKQGTVYYRLTDPRALLIRRELFVGYATEQEARADGKTAAP